jgi:hypothetical protein
MLMVYVPAVNAGTVMVIEPALSTTNVAAVESIVTADVPVKPEPVMVTVPPDGLTVAGFDVNAGATGHTTAAGAKESDDVPLAVREPKFPPQLPQQYKAPDSTAHSVPAESANLVTAVLRKLFAAATFTALCDALAAPPSPKVPEKSKPQQYKELDFNAQAALNPLAILETDVLVNPPASPIVTGGQTG